MAFLTVSGAYHTRPVVAHSDDLPTVTDMFNTASALHLQSVGTKGMMFLGGTGDEGQVLPSGDTLFGASLYSEYNIKSPKHDTISFMPSASNLYNHDSSLGGNTLGSVVGAMSDIPSSQGVPFPLNTLDQHVQRGNVQFVPNAHVDHHSTPFPTDTGAAHGLTDNLDNQHAINFVNIDEYRVFNL